MRRGFPYAITGVGAVALNDDRILLVKRGWPPGEGLWAVPGGVVEAGESLKKAVVRELEEETGLKGRPAGIIHVDKIIVRRENRVEYHYVLVAILVEEARGAPRPGGDAIDAAWIRLNEVEHFKLAASTKRIIRRVMEDTVMLPLRQGW